MASLAAHWGWNVVTWLQILSVQVKICWPDEVVAHLEDSESAQCQGGAYLVWAFLVLPVHLLVILCRIWRNACFSGCGLLVQDACLCKQRADAHPSSATVGYLLANSRDVETGKHCVETFKCFTVQVFCDSLWATILVQRRAFLFQLHKSCAGYSVTGMMG